MSVHVQADLTAGVAIVIESVGPHGDHLGRLPEAVGEGPRVLLGPSDEDFRLAVLDNQRHLPVGPELVDFVGVGAGELTGDVVEHLAVDDEVTEIIAVRKRIIA